MLSIFDKFCSMNSQKISYLEQLSPKLFTRFAITV